MSRSIPKHEAPDTAALPASAPGPIPGRLVLRLCAASLLVACADADPTPDPALGEREFAERVYDDPEVGTILQVLSCPPREGDFQVFGVPGHPGLSSAVASRTCFDAPSQSVTRRSKLWTVGDAHEVLAVAIDAQKYTTVTEEGTETGLTIRGYAISEGELVAAELDADGWAQWVSLALHYSLLDKQLVLTAAPADAGRDRLSAASRASRVAQKQGGGGDSSAPTPTIEAEASPECRNCLAENMVNTILSASDACYELIEYNLHQSAKTPICLPTTEWIEHEVEIWAYTWPTSGNRTKKTTEFWVRRFEDGSYETSLGNSFVSLDFVGGRITLLGALGGREVDRSETHSYPAHYVGPGTIQEPLDHDQLCAPVAEGDPSTTVVGLVLRETGSCDDTDFLVDLYQMFYGALEVCPVDCGRTCDSFSPLPTCTYWDGEEQFEGECLTTQFAAVDNLTTGEQGWASASVCYKLDEHDGTVLP